MAATKKEYISHVLDKAENMLEDLNLTGYGLSVANESDAVLNNPVLLVDFPDNTARAYDIPYNPQILENIEKIINIDIFINIIREDIMEFNAENFNAENTYDDYYDDEEEEYEDEDEVEEWGKNSSDEDEERGKPFNCSCKHTDSFYEDYDTDYEEDFTDIAIDYIIDHAGETSMTPEEIADLIDFTELNHTYQTNDLSFAETLKAELNRLSNLQRDNSQQESSVCETPVKEKYHTEQWYENFDTDDRKEFKKAAKKWIKDHAEMLNLPADEIIEQVKFRDLNNIYQHNNKSFAETLWAKMEELSLIKNTENEKQEPVNDETEENAYSWDNVKNKIYAAAYPGIADMNRFLSVKMADLNIVYVIHNTPVIVSNDLFYTWGISSNEFKEAVNQNMKEALIVEKLSNIFPPHMVNDSESTDVPLYIVKTDKDCLGAGSITVIDEVSKRFDNKSLYIIPSSVEEILVIPTDTIEKDMLDGLVKMVREVNKTEISPNEFLSDNVYTYDSVSKELEVYTGEERNNFLDEEEISF